MEKELIDNALKVMKFNRLQNKKHFKTLTNFKNIV